MTPHDEIMRAIGRLEGKVDGILIEAQKTNGRVTRLEDANRTHQSFIDNIKGKITIFGAVAGAIITAIWELTKLSFGAK